MKKKTNFLIIFLCFFTMLLSGKTLTLAEQSNFKETSLYTDVIHFIFEMQKKSDKITITNLTLSTEGKMVPLVVIGQQRIHTPNELRLTGFPSLLIMANIHAGEVEGKEAALMIIRDFADSLMDNVLKNQVVLILPIFNPDGNDKLGHNRRDDGPELAGVRHNGQHLDLNRDFLKLESPEVKALVKLLNLWDPVLCIDLHTTDGSYHQEPVTYTTLINPNTDGSLRKYMWGKLFPDVARTLQEKYGYDSVPFGDFVDRFDPGKGWENWALEGRFGFNYIGLRNRFSILNENYSHADFQTRVMGCYYFLKSILQFTNQNIHQMRHITDEADQYARDHYHLTGFVLESNNEKLFDLKLKSYKFEKEKIKPEEKHKYPSWFGDYIEKKTDTLMEYQLPYFSKAVALRSTTLPEAYVLLPHHDEIVGKLKEHGLVVEKLRNACNTKIEEIVFDEIIPEKHINQGHIRLNCKVHYQARAVVIPENSHLITMKQPLARLIPVLLEPESQDSLLSWGFFNREIVSQWYGTPLSYPVYRIPKIENPLESFQE